MGVWHWMYDHPDATPAELKDGDRRICAGASGTSTTRRSSSGRTSALLGIYSHMIDAFLYLPDYPLGHLIAFQIEEQIEKSTATSAASSSGWRSSAT